MKRIYVRIFAAAVAFTLIFSLMLSAFAETVYQYYGFQYTVINNRAVSVCGWDNRNTDPIIPNAIDNREVVEIANSAFMDNTTLTSVSLGKAKGLARIGMFAFKGCTSLSGKLTLPARITEIGVAAFQECSSLSTVVVKAAVSEVSDQMFYRCSNLSSITLNDSITRIGAYAFADCPALTYLEIPSGVTEIADSAFLNDDGIRLGVYRNSCAHEFAIEKNIAYVLLTDPFEETEPKTDEPTAAPVEVTFILGDADGDGYVTIVDATRIQRVLVELDDDPDGMIALRGSADGEKLNIMHATKIQRWLALFEVEEPIGEEVTRTLG